MTTLPAVPNELLLQVFSNLSKVDLCHVNLSSRLFSSLAREFLFTTLNFKPYTFDNEASLLRCPSAEDKQRLLQKLVFFRSDGVAPFVNSVSVNRLERYPGLRDAPYKYSPFEAPFAIDEDTHSLLSPFFHSITAFRNLRTLEAERITFTPMAIEVLAQLHNLHTFKIEDCALILPVEMAPPLPKIHIVNLLIRNCSGPERWLTLLAPARLQRVEFLNISLVTSTELMQLPTFPSVTALTIPLKYDHLASLVPLLNATFPAVQSLRVDGYGTTPAVATSTHGDLMFRQLQTLHAAREVAMAFLSVSPHLKDLTVPWEEAPVLLSSLAALHAARLSTIIVLNLWLEGCTSATLAALFSHFPVLESFAAYLAPNNVHRREDTESMLALTKDLPFILPPTLRIVLLRYVDSDDDESGEGLVIPDISMLTAQFLTRCAALRAVSLSVPFFTLEWDVSVGPGTAPIQAEDR